MRWTPARRAALRHASENCSVLCSVPGQPWNRQTLIGLEKDKLLRYATSKYGCGWIITPLGEEWLRELACPSRSGPPQDRPQRRLTPRRLALLQYAVYVGPLSAWLAPWRVLAALVNLGWLDGPDERTGLYSATEAGISALTKAVDLQPGAR